MATLMTAVRNDIRTFTIHPYNHSFDAGLAVMWNESDDQWPGTFNDGVPLNEERVRDWMDNIGAVMRLVVQEDATGRIAGYGDLWNDIARPGSCYVSLLNVAPDFQKQSLARRMLTRMVDWATENGYDRLTINTWSANLKAVPLYKKTGFFWQPDTGVHMENYVPAVRQLPILADFFESTDWYAGFDRVLDQVEDDMRHPRTGDTPVYVLRWANGDEAIEAVIDRNAQAITGLSTKDFSVHARVSEAEPAQGVRGVAAWELENRSGRPIEFSLTAAGDDGIEVSLDCTLMLQPGEWKTLEAPCRVAVDAPKFDIDDKGIPTPGFVTALEIDGAPLNLKTGLRYRQAVEFSLEPEIVSLVPGLSKTVLLQLHNRANHALSGMVRLSRPEGLQADGNLETLNIPAKGTAGIWLSLTADREAFYRLGACFAFEDAGMTIQTNVRELPVAALDPGGWAAGQIDEDLFLENDSFRLTVLAKGGQAKLFSKVMGTLEAHLSEELGYPFVPYDLAEQTYETKLELSGRGAKALLQVRSTRFPGAVVYREMAFSSSPVIRVRTRVVNTSEGPLKDMKLRPMSRYRRDEYRHLVVPLKLEGRTHVVREHAATYGGADGDLPEKPEKYGENWAAWEQPGYVYGVVWSGDGLEKIFFQRGACFPVYEAPELAPGVAFSAPDFLVLSGTGDWHAVQALWQRVNGQPAANAGEAYPERAGSHLAIGLRPQPLLAMSGAVQTELYAHTTREFKIDGTLAVVPPEGWQSVPQVVELEGVHNENLFGMDIELRTDGHRPGAFAGQVRLKSESLDAETPFTLIRLGQQDLSVRVTPGEETWRIDNGRTLFEVAPGFSGGLVRWQEAGSQVNHLRTSYPDPGQMTWVKPGYGGIRPVLFDYIKDANWPGKLHEETFAAESLDVEDANGIRWQGLRLRTEMQHRDWKGLSVEIDYLTVGGSNLLQARYRVVNGGAAYRKAEASFASFFQVDGRYDNAIVHTEDMRLKRAPGMRWPTVGSWVGIENPETGRTMATVVASGNRRQVALDWGKEGGHAYVMDFINVPPHASQEMTAYFALAETVEEARLYGSLAK